MEKTVKETKTGGHDPPLPIVMIIRMKNNFEKAPEQKSKLKQGKKMKRECLVVERNSKEGKK